MVLTPLFDSSLSEKVSAAGVIAVLVVDDAADAVPLARALLEGGVGVMEHACTRALLLPHTHTRTHAYRCGDRQRS